MAINPNTQYPGQVEAPDANYPYGGAKNETIVDALDGTPFEKAMLNDIFGFQQRLLSVAELTASGNSETALISQYLQALQIFMSQTKDFIINGTGVVQQRADYTLVKDAYDFGPDRFAGMATGTLVSAGTLTQTSAANVGVTGFAHKFNQVTLTGTGILFHRTRIESKDAKNFKNLKASLGCKVYHTAGLAIDYTLTVRKADVEDDFSATTEISNDGGTSVDSATATTLAFEDITMGDCSNGIEIELKIECGATTLKDFEQTEYQLEPGIVVTPFKPTRFDEILSKCQRYFGKTYEQGTDPGAVADPGHYRNYTTGLNNAVHGARLLIKTPVEMRSTPTVVLYSPVTGTAGKARDYTSAADVNATSEDSTSLIRGLTTASGASTALSIGAHATFDAELT